MTKPDLESEWTLIVGEIVAPFSRFGEVKVNLLTDFPERFERLKQVSIRSSYGDTRLMPVQTARLHKGQILLKLKGVETMNDAENLRGYIVSVRQSDAVPLASNEFYIHDLLGCEVVTEDGQTLGKITNILSNPANDIYVVGAGKDEILLPAVRDVIKSVDIAARRVVATPTPGLLPGEAEEVRSDGEE
ncbi:MAG: 16S rRNA processing protein RimM [Chthonomonadaceae bacterium]|nr:16S rRNA processing protein RimM [Chthonomonadaceae bacterium]